MVCLRMKLRSNLHNVRISISGMYFLYVLHKKEATKCDSSKTYGCHSVIVSIVKISLFRTC
jgi:hypothetical protein